MMIVRTTFYNTLIYEVPLHSISDFDIQSSFPLGDENGTLVIDLTSFDPGPHSLVVVAMSEEGEVDAAETIIFIVPETFGIIIPVYVH